MFNLFVGGLGFFFAARNLYLEIRLYRLTLQLEALMVQAGETE